MKGRTKKQSHLTIDWMKWRTHLTVIQVTDPVMSPTALWNREQPDHQRGWSAHRRTGQRRWPLAHASGCVTRYVFSVCYPTGHSLGASIYPLGSCYLETCDVIIYHVTMSGEISLPSLCGLLSVTEANVVTHWGIKAVPKGLGSSHHGLGTGPLI